MEGDCAGRVVGGVVVGVVGTVVVPVAQADGVVEVRASAAGPGIAVVSVQAAATVAPLGGTPAELADDDREALGAGEEPSGPAEVEDLGSSADDGHGEAGLAGQAPGQGRGDPLPGVEEAGLLQAPAKGLSQERVAHAAGIASYTYQKFEKGESKPGTPMNPRLTTLVALSQVLDVPLLELLPGELPDLTIGR